MEENTPPRRLLMRLLFWSMCLACIQARQGLTKVGKGDYGSVVDVCEGQRISLKADFRSRSVKQCTITKDRERDLLINKDGGVQVKDARVTYFGPTAISISDATVADSGVYDFLVFFTDNQTEWITFEVTVYEGCPDKTEFYDPIKYRFGKGVLETLTGSGVIDVHRETTILLNVTVPAARPPVTCTIRGDGHISIRNGTSHSITYCIATFHIPHAPGDIQTRHLAKVQLSHSHMDPPFFKDIYFRTIDGIPDGTFSDRPKDVEAEGQAETLTTNHRYHYVHPAILFSSVIVVGLSLLVLSVLVMCRLQTLQRKTKYPVNGSMPLVPK